MAQGYEDRMDESLGMRYGKESSKMQSYQDRRDESHGMKMSKEYGRMEDLKDGTHSSGLRSIPTNSEKYDMDRVKYESVGSKGYPAEAWNYEY